MSKNSLPSNTINNPFDSDYPGTATHLSTWNMNTKNNKFVWVKKSYTIKSEYDYELNLVHINLYYNEKHIKEINKKMYSQSVNVDNITRITQRAITEYMESW